MAKCKKIPRSLPKRIAGVKVPKSLRRAADTQLGAAIMAQMLVTGGVAALTAPGVRNAFAELRSAMARTAMALGSAVESASANAGAAIADAADRSDTAIRRRRDTDYTTAH